MENNQDMLKTYVSIPKQKYQEMDLLIQTYEMMRDELIEMGLLDKKVPPMFYTESIASNVKKMRDKAWEDGTEHRTNANQILKQKFARIAYSYNSDPWKHTPAYAHVADMVSAEIGKMILDTEV
jgi:hypothetical protein